jgi:hypothetical protein
MTLSRSTMKEEPAAHAGPVNQIVAEHDGAGGE